MRTRETIFLQRKNDVLSKIDKSSKGSWDKPILKLCDKINFLENYYTTSSCSGRIVLLRESSKGSGLILKAWHDEVSEKDFFAFLDGLKEKNFDVEFKQEPCILHVACLDVKSMKELFEKAKLAGWKNTGAIAFDKRFILDLRSTERIDFPLLRKGKFVIDESFLKLVLEESNRNLKKTWKKIDSLRKMI